MVPIGADAGDVPAQRDMAAAIQDAFGELDILFINAGIAEFRLLDAWDEAGFDRLVAVNPKGPLLPVLANPASIVLTTSINGRIGMPNSSVYALTKASLASLARTLSGGLISRGIRVNAVSLGTVVGSEFVIDGGMSTL